MLVYIHGFNSSALSFKARLIAARMAELGLGNEFTCPELPHRPRESIAVLERLLDAQRPGNTCLIGSSLGGYYAPRAAAFEKRVKACIALSGPFEWSEYFDKLPALTRDTFKVRSKSRDDAEARARAKTLTLKDVAKNITCPLYVVAGKQDRIVPWEESERLAAAASGPVVRCFIEDGNHVANNRGYRYRFQSADWMAKQLAV